MSLTAEWKEWRGIAKSNGIGSKAFGQRLQRGWTPEEAATLPLGTVVCKQYVKKNGKPPILTSEQYKIAESNGISKGLAYQRYEILFWSIEDAITKPKGKPWGGKKRNGEKET